MASTLFSGVCYCFVFVAKLIAFRMVMLDVKREDSMKMNRNVVSKIANVAKWVMGGIAALSIVVSCNAIAGEFTDDESIINAKGGLHLKYKCNDKIWFALFGLLRIDDTLFMGSARDKQFDFPSGAGFRALTLGVTGGVGEDWSYVMSVDVLGSSVILDDTYITYAGFSPNSSISIGRIPGQFIGYDLSSSLNWMPFLERNLPSIAFYQRDGIGVMGRMWWENASVIATIMQPDVGDDIFLTDASQTFGANTNRDRLMATARFVFAPVHTECDVYHFAASALWRETASKIDGTAINVTRFRAYPGGRARVVSPGFVWNTARLVDTGLLQSKNYWLLNLEAARQWGPLLINGEYFNVYVDRANALLGAVTFRGWNIQGSYILTGGRHVYDIKDGNFGIIEGTSCEFGAIELAARYDFVNLNDQDVFGGNQRNVTVGVNWFPNDNLRFSANYVRARILPGVAANRGVDVRWLDILGFQARVRF